MAAIYMNKMDGSIGVRNTKDGVEFELRLRRADTQGANLGRQICA